MPAVKKKNKASANGKQDWKLIAVIAIVVALGLAVALFANVTSQSKVTIGSKAAPAGSSLQQTKMRIELTNYLNTSAGKRAAQQADDVCQQKGPMGTNVAINTSEDFCKANWNPIISCEKEGFIPDYTSTCGSFFSGFFRACCRKESELKKVDAKKHEYCADEGLDKGCLVACSGDANDYERKNPASDALGRASDTKCAAFSGGLGLSLGSFKSQTCCTTDPAKFSNR